uniref:Uncharacterized protein n=1 Tax=Amphilophus citrinellus TaxID=61819 RepID=A0A3Q0T7G6_AMPCI
MQDNTMTELRKTFFENAPVSSNVAFSIILLIAEKIVDMEFTCPCGADCRFHFLVLLFVIPGLVAIVLMTAIQRSELFHCECGIMKNVKKFCVCIFPSAVWVTLLFLDGRYYACIKTDWLGQYVTVNHSVLEKWCEPENRTSYQELLKKSYGWYACSQVRKILIFFFFQMV